MLNIDEILNNNNNKIKLETLPKYISKPLVIIHCRYPDVDGLSSNLQLITDFNMLENSLKLKEFEIINIDYTDDYFKIGYYSGYRDHEEIHIYYNLGKVNSKKFKKIVKKYKHNITDVLDLTDVK